MINAIFTGLFKFLLNITKIFLIPVDALVSTAFPDFSEMVAVFYDGIGQSFIAQGFAYFGNLLPPNVRAFIILYLTLLIAFYTISLAVHGIVKVIEIIQSVKIW